MGPGKHNKRRGNRKSANLNRKPAMPPRYNYTGENGHLYHWGGTGKFSGCLMDRSVYRFHMENANWIPDCSKLDQARHILQ